jgi:2-C-methyl-D-erythritol 4-phosphate cytidylyltransferase
MSDFAPHSGKIWVVLPAGGAGVRMGGDTRKQYLEIAGKRILDHTLERFMSYTWVAGIVLVVPEEDREDLRIPLFPRVSVHVVSGGPTRFHSVRNGVLALQAVAEDFVFVHDAVRPLFSETLCLRVLEAAAIAALPLKGTIKAAAPVRDDPRPIARTVDRTLLWEAQTPQVFSYGALCEAYERVRTWREDECERATDEAYLFEALGRTVALVEGEETNIKITRPLDLKWMQAFLHSERSAL